ncbi:hypothetical protein Barb6XT_02285 [Bacteroidales bacterium Barb6XT]|nr:hypothetical protein Barb6XT_02285 [Bacteroidales bacterium Barb6XT]
MITRIRGSLSFYLCSVRIDTVARYDCTVFSGGQIHTITVYDKVCLKGHVLRHIKYIGIGGRKAVACCVYPFHKMITRIRGSLSLRLCSVRIDTVARYDCTVLGRQFHTITVYGKMRLNSRVACHNKCIGIGGRKAVALCICPLYKMVTRIRESLNLRLCTVRIDAVA